MTVPKEASQERGFTIQEKWIIWAVFCLLVGLSTGRITVFAGMLLLSSGVSLVAKKHRIGVAIVLCLAGLLSLAFSRFLI